MADKNFKVKTSITSPTPIAVTEGGTGQTTANNALNAMLPSQTSANGMYLVSDGTNTSWAPASGSFVAMPSSSVDSNVSLTSNNKYFIDTTSTRTLTLPGSPSVGDEIYVYDASGSASSYNITIARNSNLINGNAGNFLIDISGGATSFVYTGSTYGWKAG